MPRSRLPRKPCLGSESKLRWTRARARAYPGQSCMKKINRYLPGMVCSVSGCGKFPESNFMCEKHAQRVRRYGDPNYVTPESKRRDSSRASNLARHEGISAHYRKFHGRHEHRVVMEKHLRRALRRDEIVHHLDGNRRNNEISNLVVMSQSAHVMEHLPEMQEKANIAKRAKSRRLSFRGESKTFSEWSASTGFTIATIDGRLRRGWTVGRALGLEC